MSEPPIPPKDTSGIDVKKPKPKLVIEADQEAAPAPIPTVTLEDGEDVFADDKTPGVSTGDPAKPTLIVEEDTPEVALKEKGAPTAKPAFTVKEEDHTPAADLKKIEDQLPPTSVESPNLVIVSAKKIQAGVEEQTDPLKAGLSSDEKDDGKLSGDFIFPLRTRKSELNAFFKAFPNFPKDTVHPKISEMNFETYWNFRKYQVNNLKISLMKRLNLALSKEITELPEEDLRKLGLSNLPKEELKELGLSSLNSIPDLKKLSPEQLNLDSFNLDSLDLDTLLGNVEDSDSARVKKIKDVLSKVGLADTAANRNEYYKRMLKLYDGISIDVQKPSKEYPNGRTVITKNGDELVIIKEDLSNNLNNMIFEIPSSLTKGNDPKTLEKLDQAITAMIDQTTRMRERSDDKRLEISGYENNPRVALRIYELAILQGSKPTLHKDTLAAWRAKAISENDPNGKFAKALKDYEKLVMSKPLSTFKKLKKLAAKKIQDRAKKPATETEPTTSAPATTAYLKKM